MADHFCGAAFLSGPWRVSGRPVAVVRQSSIERFDGQARELLMASPACEALPSKIVPLLLGPQLAQR
jgi:hypothetical protein